MFQHRLAPVSLAFMLLVGLACNLSGSAAPAPTTTPNLPASATLPPSPTALPTFTPIPESLPVSASKLLFTLEGHQVTTDGGAEGVTFSPDGHLVVSVGFDGTLRLWDASNGQPLQVFNIGSSSGLMDRVVFSSDGSTLAVSRADSDATLEFINPFTGQTVHGLFPKTGGYGLALSPNGLILAVGRGYGLVSSLLDAKTGADICDLEGAGSDFGLENVAFSPSGLEVAGASQPGYLHFWDTNSCQLLYSIGKGEDSNIKDVAFSPDGRLIASGSRGGAVEIWDLATARLLFALETAGSEDVSFNSNGFLLASTSGYDVRVWDVSTGQLISEFKGHTDRVESIAFSPNGDILASASKDGTVRLWEVSKQP